MAVETNPEIPERDKPFVEFGVTGLKEFTGRIAEEFLPELRSFEQRVRTYQEMSENDPTIVTMLFVVEMMLRGVKWEVEAASNEPQDIEAKDFLVSNMEDMDMSWTEFISEVLSMVAFGWSTHEIVYKKRDDGKIGWKRLPIRSQDSLFEWIFDENGNVIGIIQMAHTDGQRRIIPEEKLLNFRTSSHKNNPEGKSILRGIYRPWYFKKHIENMQGIGIERDLAGIPVAWVPWEILDPNADDGKKAQLSAIKRIITNVKRDEQEGLVLPLMYDSNNNKMFDFTLMNSGGQRQFKIKETILYYDQKMMMRLLADFILLGHEKVGSFALSDSKTHLFAVALGALLDGIDEVLNRKAVPRLFALNSFNLEALPRFKHGDIETQDLVKLAGYLESLTRAGAAIFPDPDLEKHLKRQANLPESESEEV